MKKILCVALLGGVMNIQAMARDNNSLPRETINVEKTEQIQSDEELIIASFDEVCKTLMQMDDNDRMSTCIMICGLTGDILKSFKFKDKNLVVIRDVLNGIKQPKKKQQWKTLIQNAFDPDDPCVQNNGSFSQYVRTYLVNEIMDKRDDNAFHSDDNELFYTLLQTYKNDGELQQLFPHSGILEDKKTV